MENREGRGSRRPHIAVLPSPGLGHLFPLVELAKILVNRHHFAITFITFTSSDDKATQAFLSTLPSDITSVSLPPVQLDDLPAETRLETRLSAAVARSLPDLRTVLHDLHSRTNLVAFLADLFAADGFSIARELGIYNYIFVPSNLLFLTLMLELPALDATVKGPFQELVEPIRLPGCVPIPGSQILTPLLDRSNDCYRCMLHHADNGRQAQGILVNSFSAIEPGPAQHLIAAGRAGSQPPVYPIGPSIQSPSGTSSTSVCINWLDKQPHSSVLFVSFGSVGTLSTRQLKELAFGLEESGQRFLFVVRSPHDEDSIRSNFTSSTTDNPLPYLPEGFLERTKDLGLVVPSWAPQMEVLSHAATGGFLSHCGWNSTLESMSRGVPMIAWPLFAEQSMNALTLVEEARIAIRPKAGADGVYEREEIARVVRELIDGEEGRAARNRVKALKEAAAVALAEGGSSYTALDEVANKWKSLP